MNSNSKSFPSTSSTAIQNVTKTTFMPVEKLKLNWVIKNFERLYKKKTKGKSFAVFHFDAGESVGISANWKVCLKTGTGEDTIGIYVLLKETSTCVSAVAAFKGYFQKPEGELQLFAIWGQHKYANGSDWGFQNIKTIKDLTDQGGLANDQLTLSIEGEIYGSIRTVSTHGEENINELKSTMEKRLATDFGAILSSGEFSDVSFFVKELSSGETVEIKSHRSILSCRSPVFASMFKNNMQEAVTGKINLDDISPKAVKIMLKFIYTGEIDDEWRDVPTQLIYAADKYQLSNLLDFVEQNISTVLAVTNAYELLKSAKLYNLKNAQEIIEKYTLEHWREFLDTLN